MLDGQPEVQVPIFHWALHTPWLLRMGEEEARALMRVAEGLQHVEEQPAATPEQQVLRIAQDLQKSYEDLEILEDDPASWIRDALRQPNVWPALRLPMGLAQLRPTLEVMIQALVRIAGRDFPPINGMDPFRSVIDAHLAPETVAGLRLVGRRITAHSEEWGSTPIVATKDWGLAAGVLCDLAWSRGMLFRIPGAENFVTVTRGVHAQLDREVRALKTLLPPMPELIAAPPTPLRPPATPARVQPMEASR